MPITGNAIDQAERTRAELVKRLETLRADRAANEERRAALAFDAETGDAAAKRSIAELTKAAAALDVDVQTVEAAIAEAARRVRAAADASRRQAERDKARQARAILARLRTASPRSTPAFARPRTICAPCNQTSAAWARLARPFLTGS